jgi:hypothetical protein
MVCHDEGFVEKLKWVEEIDLWILLD